MTKLATMVAVAALAVLGSTAHAQITSIPPTLQGQPSSHLWSIAGVVNSGGLGTVVTCTNVNTSPSIPSVLIGVQVFNAAGAAVNDPSATAVDLGPGGTVAFGTVGLAGIGVNTSLAVGSLTKGAARVLATAKAGIICGALIADTTSAPPVSMASLTIVKKTKQTGD